MTKKLPKARSDLFLKALRGPGTQKQLSADLGIQQGAVAAVMKPGHEVEYKTIANYCKRYRKHGCLIKPLFEMWKLPQKLSDLPKEHRELLGKKGIYALFDSLGKIIYIGKTEKRDFEFELFAVRLRNKVNGNFKLLKSNGKTKENKAMSKTHVLFKDIAVYFSAYEVDDGHIGDIEALLTHLLANTTLNAKMERFKVYK